ncbi:MAG: hypothetical protein KJO60_01150 [Desulfofustis sp.]|nr:hypothetical protein [Desulfofustis sp.]
MQTLAKQLAAQKEGFLKQAPPEVVEIMSGAMATLKASDLIDRALKAGDTAPLFELLNATGETISLQQRLTGGPAIVTFYRGVW